MEKFYKTIEIDGYYHRFCFIPVFNDILQELYYIVVCKGFEPFIMAYDFENASGLNIQGTAPYFVIENENLLSHLIESYNDGF